jgi:hypothetical protein
MSKDASTVAEIISRWAQEQWDEAGLRPEGLIARHQELCEQHLKQTPEKLVQGILSPLVPILTPPSATKPGSGKPSTGKPSAGKPGSGKPDVCKTDTLPITLAPVVTALSGLEKLLGLPEDLRTGNPASYPVGVIEKALDEVAARIADDLDRKLTALIVRLIEEPAYRLAGAEEGLRQFCLIAEQALQTQETLTKELNDRTVILLQRIQALLEAPLPENTPPTNSVWKLGFARKPTGPGGNSVGADLLELLRIYAKTRYQSLILRHINRFYVGLRGHLSDQIREVGFCRQRLGELAGLLEDKPESAAPPLASFEKLLLPQQCATIADAVNSLDAKLTQDDLVAFDGVMQPIIRQQYRALVQVCMGPSNLVRTLAPLMNLEAEEFLAMRFGNQGSQDAELSQEPQDGADALNAGFDEAAPELGRPSAHNEIAFAAFPATAAGEQLKNAAGKVLRNVQFVDTDDGDEIVFYRERQEIALKDLEQFGSIAQEAYRQACAADPAFLHSRADIPAWQSAAP